MYYSLLTYLLLYYSSEPYDNEADYDCPFDEQNDPPNRGTQHQQAHMSNNGHEMAVVGAENTGYIDVDEDVYVTPTFKEIQK